MASLGSRPFAVRRNASVWECDTVGFVRRPVERYVLEVGNVGAWSDLFQLRWQFVRGKPQDVWLFVWCQLMQNGQLIRGLSPGRASCRFNEWDSHASAAPLEDAVVDVVVEEDPADPGALLASIGDAIERALA